MKKFLQKIQKFYYFRLANPIVQQGEGHGFKYTVRRFWLDLETVSGNWKMRVVASEHPFGYLVSGLTKKSEDNLFGFAETMYYLNSTLTRDQKLVNDVQNALRKYEARLAKTKPEPDNEEEEAAAIAEVKAVQEYVEATPKERKKQERDINGRFKKAVKDVEARDLQEKK